MMVEKMAAGVLLFKEICFGRRFQAHFLADIQSPQQILCSVFLCRLLSPRNE